MRSNYVNPLPGVPIVESPFFEEIFLDGAIDPETHRIARDLREDGFAVFNFPDEAIARVADDIRASLGERYAWEEWRQRRIPDLRVMDAWHDNDHVRSVATNEGVLSLLGELYGRKAFPFQTLNFAVGTQQHYHTDALHFSSTPERFMCGVWLALEDIGPDQGPLLYYPGSHRWPIYTNEHVGHSYYETRSLGPYKMVWERLVETHGAQPARFYPKKGQAAIWAANLLHGGDAHHDRGLTRWSQVTHYYFEDCAYYTPSFSDPMYGPVLYREPMNILTGEVVPNFYNGRPISRDQIDHSQLDNFPPVPFELPDGFDPQTYLSLNPDVRDSGIDPILHYRRFGEAEGRPISLDQVECGLCDSFPFPLPDGFDADAYLDLNPDVKKAGLDPKLHYQLFGRTEGRLYSYA